MDIALILSKIRPNAKWRMSGTYEQLANTWEDEEQKLPSLQEITDAWEKINNPPLEELKAKKRIELDALTGQKITGGFNMPIGDKTVRFDSDIETQITMQGIAINANTDDFKIKYPDGAPVRGIPEGKTEKEILMLDGPSIIKFCANLSEHIGQCKQRGWELQQAVDLAENEEMLNNIKW